MEPQLPAITAQQKNDDLVAVYWAPPSDVDENRITGYSVRCRTEDGSFERQLNVSGSKTETTLSDLPQDGALVLSVTYFTALGRGATSREAEITLGGW